jgi:NAD-dependent deacetylase
MAEALDRVRAGEADPACEICGGILKSATVMFGQSLDPVALQRAQRAAVEADVLVAVGTSLTVYPVAGIVPEAFEAGRSVIILNAEETPFDPIAAAVVRGSASEVLPRLVRAGR